MESETCLALVQHVCAWSRHGGGRGLISKCLFLAGKRSKASGNFFARHSGCQDTGPHQLEARQTDDGCTSQVDARPESSTPRSASPLHPPIDAAYGLLPRANHPQCPSPLRATPATPPSACARHPDPPSRAPRDSSPLPAACPPRAHATMPTCKTSRAPVSSRPMPTSPTPSTPRAPAP